MKKFAKIAAIVVGMSTAAVAQPWSGDRPVQNHRTYDENGRANRWHGQERPYDRGYGNPAYTGQRLSGWVPIASRFANTPRELINLRPPGGERATALVIVADRGAPYIDSVVVHYGDHTAERFDMHRRLRPGEHMRLDLNGRRIVLAINVHAAPERRASYTILAQRW